MRGGRLLACLIFLEEVNVGLDQELGKKNRLWSPRQRHCALTLSCLFLLSRNMHLREGDELTTLYTILQKLY